jgi:riboflavin kinase/FMN adenylyltransferase
MACTWATRRWCGRATARARALGVPAVALSFEPLPREFFAKDAKPPRLMLPRAKLDGLLFAGLRPRRPAALQREAGVDAGRGLRPRRAGRPPVAREVWVGPGVPLRQGPRRRYRAAAGDGRQLGFTAHDDRTSARSDGERVSSTRIRDGADDRRFRYGRPSCSVAPMRSADTWCAASSSGRTLGYPTANLRYGGKTPALRGIYATWVHGVADRSHGRRCRASARGPPSTASSRLLEAHLFDFDGDLYGRHIEVEFVAKLRDEEKFPDLRWWCRCAEQMHGRDPRGREARRAVETFPPEHPTVREADRDVTDKQENPYKATILLPETAFPMRGDLPKREPETLARWESRACTRSCATTRRAARCSCCTTARRTPTARSTWATRSTRSSRTSSSSRRPGRLRCALHPGLGLPRPADRDRDREEVGQGRREARCGRVPAEVPRIRQRADRPAAQGLQAPGRDRRLGQPVPHARFPFEADEIRALAKVVENGHLLRGVKPVYWCFDCGSALAEAEIEYQDKVSPAVDVAYAARDPQALRRASARTAGRCRGRAADLDHHAVDAAGVAGDLAGPGARIRAGRRPGARWRRAGWCWPMRWPRARCSATASTEVVVHGRAKGEGARRPAVRAPVLRRARHPDAARRPRVAEDGTGAVHTAPGHGQEDFAVSQAVRPARQVHRCAAQSGRWPRRVPAVDAAGGMAWNWPACMCGRPTTCIVDVLRAAARCWRSRS